MDIVRSSICSIYFLSSYHLTTLSVSINGRNKKRIEFESFKIIDQYIILRGNGWKRREKEKMKENKKNKK